MTSQTLPNGLQVLYLHLSHVHSSAVTFMTRAGSRHETPRTNGLSHVMEHLLFRGTRSHPSSLAFHTAIEALGAEINGLTQRDAVTVELTIPPRALPEGLRLLAEVCTEPLLTGLDVERNVILEEILDTQDVDGRELDIDTLSRLALWKHHPIGMSITGPPANVRGFTEADARAHFAQTFCASNAVLCIAGPVPPFRLRDTVAAAFSKLPRGAPPAPQARPVGPRWAPVQIQPTDDAQVTMLFTVPAPHEQEPGHGALLLLRRVLDDGFGARLRQAICEQRGLAYSLGVSLDAYGDCAALDIEVSCAPAKLVPTLSQILAVLDEVARVPVSAAELDRVKTRHLADMEFSLDDPSALCSWYGGSALVGSTVDAAARDAHILAITPAEVRALAARLFSLDNALLTLVGPVEPAQAHTLSRMMQRAPSSAVWLSPPERYEIEDVSVDAEADDDEGEAPARAV